MKWQVQLLSIFGQVRDMTIFSVLQFFPWVGEKKKSWNEGSNIAYHSLLRLKRKHE